MSLMKRATYRDIIARFHNFGIYRGGSTGVGPIKKVLKTQPRLILVDHTSIWDPWNFPLIPILFLCFVAYNFSTAQLESCASYS